jgi:hypothetical protein
VSAPCFLPLVCPRCSADLAGRAVDRVAFCPPCRRAYRLDDAGLADLPARRATRVPLGDGELFALPFWLRGPIAAPAFLGARPLTVARIATRALSEWSVEEGLEPPFPLGSRVAPAALPQICRLARLSAPAADAPLALLSVPARFAGGRIQLPGAAGTLYPDDVLEGRLLTQR